MNLAESIADILGSGIPVDILAAFGLAFDSMSAMVDIGDALKESTSNSDDKSNGLAVPGKCRFSVEGLRE